MNIILCDDEKGVANALTLLLQALGHAVQGYTNPQLAIDAAKEATDTDLFICDLRMPEQNGLEVLAQIRLIRPFLPFILMSAHAQEEEIAEANLLGANAFLAKPFTPDEFQAAVDTALKVRK